MPKQLLKPIIVKSFDDYLQNKELYDLIRLRGLEAKEHVAKDRNSIHNTVGGVPGEVTSIDETPDEIHIDFRVSLSKAELSKDFIAELMESKSNIISGDLVEQDNQCRFKTTIKVFDPDEICNILLVKQLAK